ncbi:putative 1-deoxy-d-xylulose-5-phosphate synthase [Quercus suber]|uniref:1-deoxy-d-xylulose-5-phosphate synthase n=1 Tax=Quercus suber TaxID=58331 RepID=A0AAW0L9U8_QUESU
MASSILRASFLPLFHSQEPHSFPSSTNLATLELKYKKVIAAKEKNASEKVKTMVKRDHKTKQNGGIKKYLNFSGEKPLTPILDSIICPIHMKNLSTERLFTRFQGLGAPKFKPGVAELTVALHHVFDCPDDKIIWDVGHQSYPHKILTGRRSRMHTIRQTCGLAGFPKRDESIYDAFGAGHSSTSISAGLGDGAMTAGQAYEAMNNAGYLDTNLIIILNDNEQVSLPTATVDGPAPPVGALSRALTRLHSSRKFHQLREVAKGITKKIGEQAHEIAAKVDSCMRGMVGGAQACLFEELGLFYIGPVDGHNVEDLVYILKKVKDLPSLGPVLIHVTTEKGKGYAPAEVAADKMHAQEHEFLITAEEGSIGGFSSHVSHFLGLNGLLDGNLKWRVMLLPDRYIDHGAQTDQMEAAGLSTTQIAATVLSLIGNPRMDSVHFLNM